MEDIHHLNAASGQASRDDSNTTLPGSSSCGPGDVVSDTLVSGELVASRYRVTRLIGRGGMGEVYEAHDLLLEERVALKILRAAGDATLAERFRHEASLARKVTHPNVCRIFEVGTHTRPGHTPLPFLTMELLEGGTLADRILAGTLPRSEAFPIAAQLADGLAAAHRAGIVHADFKSSNVVLVPLPGGTRAVITDFGIARRDVPTPTSDETGSVAGQIAGTLPYMSPEQLAGDRLTPASDIYSFGVVLFEMASGRRPFDERSQGPTGCPAAMTVTAVRRAAPHIDPRWAAAITRCLQPDPARRFPSAARLGACFRDRSWWQIGQWTARETVMASAGVMLALAAIATVWSWATRPYRPQPTALASYHAGIDALHSMAYDTARRAFERAIDADPAFALAHAGLARALDELDYTGRAKDAMLRAVAVAQDTRLTPGDARWLRAVQFIVSRDYARAEPLLRETEADGRDGAAAALEAGWLAQRTENSEAALAAFERALALNPSYAAARLRLGFLFGRRGRQDDLSLALAAFDEAERLYTAAGNDEGVTQALFERANLLDRRSRETEALPIVDRALQIARAAGSRYHEIRLLLLQGTAHRDLGNVPLAAATVQRAIEMAATEGMDNLATSGLIDLGNIHLLERDLVKAEVSFTRAVESARRANVRRTEARAQAMLASLYEQDHRPTEARPLIESALTFYQASGYGRESLQTTLILGDVLRQLGEYEEGLRILRGAVALAIQLQDRRAEAILHERVAKVLRDRGEWPSALAEYDRAIALHPSVSQAQYIRVAAAGVLWRLGRVNDAAQALAGAEAFEAAHRDPHLQAVIRLHRAEMASAQGRLDRALALTDATWPTGETDESGGRLALLRASVQIRQGRVGDGLGAASQVLDSYERAKLRGAAATGRLLVAEALLAAGERPTALRTARLALAYLGPQGMWEAGWRGHAVASRAADTPSEISTHRFGASTALTHLGRAWGAPVVDQYLARPDVDILARDLRAGVPRSVAAEVVRHSPLSSQPAVALVRRGTD